MTPRTPTPTPAEQGHHALCVMYPARLTPPPTRAEQGDHVRLDVLLRDGAARAAEQQRQQLLLGGPLGGLGGVRGGQALDADLRHTALARQRGAGGGRQPGNVPSHHAR